MRSKLSQIFNLIITAAVLSVDLSGGTQLDIIPDLNGLMVCNSSVVFTCTLQTAPLIAMAWHIDGTPVAECTASQCGTPFPSMPSHHTTTFISGTTTELRINPVKLSDNYTVSCTDGTEASIVTSVKVGALPLTYSVTTQGDETNITIVSSCVFSPRSSVKFRIQNNNTGDALNLVNGNNVLTPTEYVACTDAENPNCGGSNTAKAKAILTITTQATGTPTEISIVAVQSDEDLSPPQYIGSYILKVPEAEEPDSSTDWCKDNLNDCVAVIVVPIGILLMIITAVVIFLNKKEEVKLVFKDVPLSIDVWYIMFGCKQIQVRNIDIDMDDKPHADELDGYATDMNVAGFLQRKCTDLACLNRQLPSEMMIGGFKFNQEKDHTRHYVFEYPKRQQTNVSVNRTNTMNKKEEMVIFKAVPLSKKMQTFASKLESCRLKHITISTDCNIQKDAVDLKFTVLAESEGTTLPIEIQVDGSKYIKEITDEGTIYTSTDTSDRVHHINAGATTQRTHGFLPPLKPDTRLKRDKLDNSVKKIIT